MTDLEKLKNVFKSLNIPFIEENEKDVINITIDYNEKTEYYDTVGVDFVFTKDQSFIKMDLYS